MNFDYSPKVKQLESRLRNFMDAQVYPSALRRIVEPLPPGVLARRGTQQHRVRAAMRDHGTSAVGAGGVQLLGA